jgi:MFS family permease
VSARADDSLVAQRDFALFWCARVASNLSYQMLSVAVGWQVYALTGRALDLGLVGLAQFLPSFLLVLVVGQVADHFDRRRTVQASAVVQGVAILALAIGSFTGRMGVSEIFAMVVVVGAARAFQQPAMQALLPALVPRQLLSRAIAANSSGSQAAFIAGPALGGVLYVAGPTLAYGVATAMLVATVATTALIRLREAPAAPGKVTLESVLAGIRFIRSRPAVLGAISLDLFAVLLGGATALLPIYARDILHSGPWALGVLRAGSAVGALAMALWLMRHPIRHRAGRTMFAAVAVFGVATIVFGVSRSFTLSLVALVTLGAADMVSVVVRQSLVQLETPDAMRGRVSAVNALFIGTSNQLGEFESGVTAAWFGVVSSVLIGGVGTLLVVALWMRMFPALARIDRLEHGSSEAT